MQAAWNGQRLSRQQRLIERAMPVDDYAVGCGHFAGGNANHVTDRKIRGSDSCTATLIGKPGNPPRKRGCCVGEALDQCQRGFAC